ncbi:unnamed protein product [Chilo suppressalis]|uniref:Retinol dehydrogenase 11 n=1 Tax=Chilo suppressalis TaxID=168631 RepID=A0ABN8BEP4_CHISP|nr:unnamed protein product [Chilo suppressalis]
MYSELVAVPSVLITAAAISILVKKKLSYGVCVSKVRLDGKTCVVTGGTSGMGLEIAKDFAKRGARVIIACPFPQEGNDAKENIVKESGNQEVVFKHLNLASLDSTRNFALDILRTEHRLDILINNAGIGSLNKLTADGMLYTMQINYYGHFLLTNLLLPLLKNTGTPEDKSRIVNVASILHHTGKYEYGNMNKPGIKSMLQSYSNSKLCLLLFAQELDRRLEGSNVIVNSVDPGTVGTTIFERNFGKYGGSLIGLWLNLFWKTPWHGAQTTIHAAVAESVRDTSGKLFRDCEQIAAHDSVYDTKAAKTLWDESKKLVQLNSIDKS